VKQKKKTKKKEHKKKKKKKNKKKEDERDIALAFSSMKWWSLSARPREEIAVLFREDRTGYPCIRANPVTSVVP